MYRYAALLLGPLVGLLALSACGGGTAAPTNGLLAKPVRAPAVTGPALVGSGDVAVLQAGTVTVVNFYGSWCSPCRAETPTLVTIAKAHPTVRFVGVDVLDSRSNGEAFVKRYAVPYPSIFDADGEDLAKFPGVNPSAVPSTLIIDRDGKIAARYTGPVGDGTAFSAALDQVVAGQH